MEKKIERKYFLGLLLLLVVFFAVGCVAESMSIIGQAVSDGVAASLNNAANAQAQAMQSAQPQPQPEPMQEDCIIKDVQLISDSDKEGIFNVIVDYSSLTTSGEKIALGQNQAGDKWIFYKISDYQSPQLGVITLVWPKGNTFAFIYGVISFKGKSPVEIGENGTTLYAGKVKLAEIGPDGVVPNAKKDVKITWLSNPSCSRFYNEGNPPHLIVTLGQSQ